MKEVSAGNSELKERNCEYIPWSNWLCAYGSPQITT